MGGRSVHRSRREGEGGRRRGVEEEGGPMVMDGDRLARPEGGLHTCAGVGQRPAESIPD